MFKASLKEKMHGCQHARAITEGYDGKPMPHVTDLHLHGRYLNAGYWWTYTPAFLIQYRLWTKDTLKVIREYDDVISTTARCHHG